MIFTVSEPPSMPSPDTLAVRSPVVEGVKEKFDAPIGRVAVAEPAVKVTVKSRLLSQDCSWVMVTVTSSSSVVSLPPASA